MQVEMQKTKENIGWRQKGRTESESNDGVQTYMGIVDDNLVEVQLRKDVIMTFISTILTTRKHHTNDS